MHEVEPEDLHRCERQRRSGRDRQRKQHDLADPGAEKQPNDFADIGVGGSALLDAGDDRGEVVIGDNEIGRRARHVCPARAHGHAYMRSLQRRGIVDAIARHSHEVALLLQLPHDDVLLRRLDARKHRRLANS